MNMQAARARHAKKNAHANIATGFLDLPMILASTNAGGDDKSIGEYIQ
jgi:hypothetical protein